MFPIVDATGWPVDEVDEELGTKEKDWLRHPGSGERWLFKQVRSTERGEPGEDWAEKVVEQLGLHLGLPLCPPRIGDQSKETGHRFPELRVR